MLLDGDTNLGPDQLPEFFRKLMTRADACYRRAVGGNWTGCRISITSSTF